MRQEHFQEQIQTLAEGYTLVRYRGRTWGLSKSVLCGGRSIKLYAEELGGSDFISCNIYSTDSGLILKPCEMPKEKVLRFLGSLTCDRGPGSEMPAQASPIASNSPNTLPSDSPAGN